CQPHQLVLVVVRRQAESESNRRVNAAERTVLGDISDPLEFSLRMGDANGRRYVVSRPVAGHDKNRLVAPWGTPIRSARVASVVFYEFHSRRVKSRPLDVRQTLVTPPSAVQFLCGRTFQKLDPKCFW